MWKIISKCRILSQRNSTSKNSFAQGIRFFLTDSFRCQESWERRLQTPILQNLKLNEFYHDLDQKFQNNGKASAIDIDLFANAVREESFVDELQDLIHKLRLSANAVYIKPSTHHAFIRSLLALNKYDDLLQVLNDRINYGIFPDDYCACLLMDTFIKENKFTEATQVSVLQMLQEDWSHPLTRHLALASCHLFLRNTCSWVEETQPEEEDSGEEIKVRVKFLRNPYFDDHFDLRDPRLLVGKTLVSIGATFPDAVGRTYQLVGWCMYKKWDKLIPFLDQLLKSGSKPAVYQEGVKMAEDILEELAKQNSDPAVDVKDSVMPLLDKLKSDGLASDDDLHIVIMNKVKDAVVSEEEKMIEQQTAIYKDWEVAREIALQEEMKKLDTLNRLDRIQQEKQELVRREQELFFFDNEEKWDLIIEKKEVLKAAKEEEEKKRKKKMKTSHIDPDYIPPEV